MLKMWFFAPMACNYRCSPIVLSTNVGGVVSIDVLSSLHKHRICFDLDCIHNTYSMIFQIYTDSLIFSSLCVAFHLRAQCTHSLFCPSIDRSIDGSRSLEPDRARTTILIHMVHNINHKRVPTFGSFRVRIVTFFLYQQLLQIELEYLMENFIIVPYKIPKRPVICSRSVSNRS